MLADPRKTNELTLDDILELERNYREGGRIPEPQENQAPTNEITENELTLDDILELERNYREYELQNLEKIQPRQRNDVTEDDLAKAMLWSRQRHLQPRQRNEIDDILEENRAIEVGSILNVYTEHQQDQKYLKNIDKLKSEFPQHFNLINGMRDKGESLELIGKVIDTKERQKDFGVGVNRFAVAETSKEAKSPVVKSALERIGIKQPGEKLGFMDGIEEIKNNPSQLVPFLSGAAAMKDIAEVAVGVYALERGEATEEQLQLLKKFVDKASQDTTFWYNVVGVVAMLPAFAGELVATSGVYSAVTKGSTRIAREMIQNLLKGKAGKLLTEELAKRTAKGGISKAGATAAKKTGEIALKSAAHTIGATAQTPLAGAFRIGTKTIEHMMPEFQLSESEKGEISGIITEKGDDLLPAVAKAFGDQWVETVSEHSGGLFLTVGSGIRNSIIKTGIVSSFKKKNPGAKAAAFRDLLRRAGWNGIINEMLEERAGEVGRAALGLQGYEVPDAQQLLLELTAFTIPGVAFIAAETALNKGSIGKKAKLVEPEKAAKEEIVTEEIEEKAKPAEPEKVAKEEIEEEQPAGTGIESEFLDEVEDESDIEAAGEEVEEELSEEEPGETKEFTAAPIVKQGVGKKRLPGIDLGTPKSAALVKAEQREATPEEEGQEEPADIKDMTPQQKIASFVSTDLINKKKLTSQYLFDIADKAFGGTMAQGKYVSKDAYEGLESGINSYIRNEKALLNTNAPSHPQFDATEKEKVEGALSWLNELLERIPTQTRRTEKSNINQQFSAPPTIAYLLNWLANIQKNDSYLEPSAGNGGLAVFGHVFDANNIWANEIDDARKSNLKNLQIFEEVFQENAEVINDVLPDNIKPTIVVMNPPFSKAQRLKGKRDLRIVTRHIESAFDRLENNGRLVALAGESMHPENPKHSEFFARMSQKGNLRASVAIPGEAYRKYGTSFGTRMLVFDKTESDQGNQPVIGNVESLEELVPLLEGVRNERISPESPGTESGSKKADQGTLSSGSSSGEAVRGSTSGSSDLRRSDTGGSVNRGLGDKSSIQDEAEESLGFSDEGIDTGRRDRYSVPGRQESDRSSESDSAKSGGSDQRNDVFRSLETENVSQSQRNDNKQEEEELNSIEDDDVSIFDVYQPTVVVKGAAKHPAKLVESAAMASVQAPAVKYKPKLDQKFIDSGNVSDVQTEAVIYAGAAHEQILPNGQRKGLADGDGTGVGKGRTIAAIIRDNWNQGRKKAVWISQNAPLEQDAKRDINDIGWEKPPVISTARIRLQQDIKDKEGILYTTYNTLAQKEKQSKSGEKKNRSDLKRRIDQIVSWLGEDFDGVVAFDEAHNMGNAIDMGSRKASKKALAGVELQERLPNARVVYVSATGATKLENLSYMTRLGLWGEGTQFRDNIRFIESLSDGGIAAMEYVARDLKAMGLYLARSISYEGIEYNPALHTLEAHQRDAYDKTAAAWQTIMNSVEGRMKESGFSGQPRGGVRSTMYSSIQRFYNNLLTSYSVPTVLANIKEDLEQNKSIVLQLVNTGEAQQERAINRAQAEGQELDDVDLSPKDVLIDFLKNGYPTQIYETYVDSNGNEKKRLTRDSQNNAVQSKAALAEIDALIETVKGLPLPENAMNQILDEFGDGNVAEVTGRKRRLVRDSKTGAMIEQKRGKRISDKEVSDFMDENRRILIFSMAGGTGRSYHADLRRKNQQKRVHYVLQPGWQADKAIQGLGRTHRSNQAQPPEYRLVTTDVPAQKRFVATIAKRLDHLGALTRGQRQAGSQGLFSSEANLESKYGEDAGRNLIRDIVDGQIEGLNEETLEKMLGLNVTVDGAVRNSMLPRISRLLNRLLMTKLDDMDIFFNELNIRLRENIELAIRSGSYDAGVETQKAVSFKELNPQTVHVHESGAETIYSEIEVVKKNPIVPYEAVKNEPLYRNKNSKKIYSEMKRYDKTIRTTGRVVNSSMLRNTNDRRQSISVKNLEEKFDLIEENQRETAWNNELKNNTPATRKEFRHFITGSLLPIWGKLTTSDTKIVRYKSKKGSLLGRVIKDDEIDNILDRIGAEKGATNVTPEDAVIRLFDNGEQIKLFNGWTIKISRVSGDKRIELVGPSSYDADLLKRWGIFTESFQYRERYFIPTDSAKAVIENIFKAHPPEGAAAKESKQIISDDEYKRAKDDLKDSMNNVNFSIDPNNLLSLTKVGIYHFQNGAQTLLRFIRKMRADFGENYNKIKGRIREIFRKSKDAYEKQEPADTDIQGEARPLELRPETRKQWFVRVIQDKLNRLKYIQTLLPNITDETDTYMKAELFIGRASDKLDRFNKYMTEEKDSFIARLTRAGYSVDDFGEYLYAQHAKERNKHIREASNGEKKSGSGLSDEEADKIIAVFDETDIEDYAQEFRQNVTELALKIRKNAGLIDEATFDLLSSHYDFYVPLKTMPGEFSRRSNIGRGFSVIGKDIIRARGRSTLALNPMIQAMADFSDAVVRAEKNKVGKTFLKMVIDNPSDYWEVESLRYMPRYDSEGEIAFMDPRYKLADNVLEVKVNGKVKYITIHDVALAKGMKNLGVEKGIRLLDTVNSYLRGVNTFVNPEFIITNFERDIQTALINVAGENGRKIAQNMIKDLPKAMSGIWGDIRSSSDKTWAKNYRELKKFGGKVGWFDYKTIEQKIDDVKRKASRFQSRKNVLKFIDSLGKIVTDSNEVVESGVRLAAYVNFVNAGMSKEKAAQSAKNLTVNFNKKGTVGQMINSLYLFSNAGIQGTARIFSAMKHKTTRRILFGLTTASFIQSAINRAIGGDDWERFSDWNKDNHWLFLMPDGNAIAIKVPYGYNIFKVIGNLTEEMAFGGLTLPEAGSRLISAAQDAFNPLGGHSLAQFIAPTVIRPIVEIGTNENFFGGPIRPDQPPFQPKKPESQLFFSGVRPYTKAFTDWLNEVTGGNETERGFIDQSPEDIDHLIDFMGGGLLRFVQNSYRTTTELLSTGDFPEPNKVPMVRQIVKTPDEWETRRVLREFLDESARNLFNERQTKRFFNVNRIAVEAGDVDPALARRYRNRFRSNQRRVRKARGISADVEANEQ